MEWKYYNLMTKEDKEEFDYKFLDENTGEFITLICMAWKFYFYVMSFIMLVTLVIKDYIEDYKNFLGGFVVLNVNLLQVLFIITIIGLIITIIGFIIVDFSKRKWLRNKGYLIKFGEFDLLNARKKQEINNRKNVLKLLKNDTK